MNLYLYDFDGTLSDKDSMIAFIFFIKKKHKLIISLALSLIFLNIFLEKLQKANLKKAY